ncbi:MAG: hypothetical protein IRY99_02840 [Isosphaeraceae bacterium]|nr:hypothetical protein [Isosphaeraceae bacterium]
MALQRVQRLPQIILAKAFHSELVPTVIELARREIRSYETASELLALLKASTNGEAKRPRARKSSKRVTASDENLLEFMECIGSSLSEEDHGLPIMDAPIFRIVRHKGPFVKGISEELRLNLGEQCKLLRCELF